MPSNERMLVSVLGYHMVDIPWSAYIGYHFVDISFPVQENPLVLIIANYPPPWSKDFFGFWWFLYIDVGS